jgi:hypothetical protein
VIQGSFGLKDGPREFQEEASRRLRCCIGGIADIELKDVGDEQRAGRLQTDGDDTSSRERAILS